LDSLISAVTLFKNVSSHAISKKGSLPHKEKIDVLLRNLSNGITNLLNVRENINGSRSQNRPSNQIIASHTFDIVRHTKELVGLLN